MFKFNCYPFHQTQLVKVLNHAIQNILFPDFTFHIAEPDLATTLKILKIYYEFDFIAYMDICSLRMRRFFSADFIPAV